MKKACLVIAILAAFGSLSEAVAMKSIPINPGGVIQRMCSPPPYEACIWCTQAHCYFVFHCTKTRCTYDTSPAVGGKPVRGTGITPIINGKPVQAPLPPKGSKPTGAAPTEPSHPVILERSGGGKSK
jgi:hypothetical protein